MVKKELSISLFFIAILIVFSYMEEVEKYGELDFSNRKGYIIKSLTSLKSSLPIHGYEGVFQLTPPTPPYDPAGLEWLPINEYQPRQTLDLTYLYQSSSFSPLF